MPTWPIKLLRSATRNWSCIWIPSCQMKWWIDFSEILLKNDSRKWRIPGFKLPWRERGRCLEEAIGLWALWKNSSFPVLNANRASNAKRNSPGAKFNVLPVTCSSGYRPRLAVPNIGWNPAKPGTHSFPPIQTKRAESLCRKNLNSVFLWSPSQY